MGRGRGVVMTQKTSVPEVIIVGAGAIGRGFLPWVLADHYELVFVDQNADLVRELRDRGEYATYRVQGNKLEERTFKVKAAYLPEAFTAARHLRAAAAFINVGPRHCAQAAKTVRDLGCPIIVCENDPKCVTLVKNAVGWDEVYYAIPDVITSNEAPNHLKRVSPLAVVSESGTLYVDARAQGLRGELKRCDESELSKQWTAKLYLHNTPHCIAAYIGAHAGLNYIHEVMKDPELYHIVYGAMDEMLRTLKAGGDIPHPFLEWYAAKELSRFACGLLHDPISRVAREPLRKLEPEGRLIGAAQFCLSYGILPENILFGIAAALDFKKDSADSHMEFMGRALTQEQLLTSILSLRKGEALEKLLSRNLKGISEKLSTITGHQPGSQGEPHVSKQSLGA